MNRLKLLFWSFLFVLSAVWLLADTLAPSPFGYWSFRTVFIQYSGVLGMGMMSLAMLLAIRPKRMERSLDGLDKMYRLHKWLGIGGLVAAVLHWWWAQGSKWMVGWGWLARPARRAAPELPLSQVEQFMRSQRGLAESLGEWAFYAAVLLIALALIKSFPYRWFRKTHKWIAVAYLVLVFHSAILMKFEYWSQPVAWICAALMVIGTYSALLVLAGRVARSRRVEGRIRSLRNYPGVRVIEGCIQLDEGWPGHRPGQFAFVTSDVSEGAHPYTIASAWNPDDPSLTFIVKELGDWTGSLGDRLHVGMHVAVEGPYGCFDFEDRRSRQIWIGAGIGITPFVAKMKHLAREPSGLEIDLFHVTTDHDDKALDRLEEDARAAGIRLHLKIAPRDGRLTPEDIRQAVPEWREASLWFCGPYAYGHALRKDFLGQGLGARDFHQELFQMR